MFPMSSNTTTLLQRHACPRALEAALRLQSPDEHALLSPPRSREAGVMVHEVKELGTLPLLRASVGYTSFLLAFFGDGPQLVATGTRPARVHLQG